MKSFKTLLALAHMRFKRILSTGRTTGNLLSDSIDAVRSLRSD
jgi:hypothetical protein